MKLEPTVNDLVCCPYCLNDYSLSEARPCYQLRFKNCDDILFVALCNSCRKELKPEQYHIGQHALHRIGKNLLSNPERWLSATSEVAMVMNDYNFCDALENGHGLTLEAYSAVKQGNYCRLAHAQSGLIMMWTTK
jgi:hypothetical protein